MLSISEVCKPPVFVSCYNFKNETNKCEKYFYESFPFPKSQPFRAATNEVKRIGDWWFVRYGTLALRCKVSSEYLNCPPQPKNDKEWSRKSVTPKVSHVRRRNCNSSECCSIAETHKFHNILLILHRRVAKQKALVMRLMVKTFINVQNIEHTHKQRSDAISSYLG